MLDWKEVFNKLDERLTNIMHARRHELVLTDKEAVVSEGTPTRDVETDVRELKTILKFTAQVLENSIFKDVYNSAEVSVSVCNSQALRVVCYNLLYSGAFIPCIINSFLTICTCSCLSSDSRGIVECL